MGSRLINICGRGSELLDFDNSFMTLRNDEFAISFLFHLRNYSQHGGLPLTGASKGGSWNEERTELTYAGLKQRFGESRVDLTAYGRTQWS